MIDTKFLLVPDIVKQANIENSPIKRLLTVHDVVPAFEFLLSGGADCITGQNIAVTAGN
jgi:3-oxoacyl-[acyl-carrier protein] reductase